MVELTVSRALALAAARAGEQPALHCADRALSHRALDALANRIANALLGIGLARTDRVALLLPNGIEYVAAAIACAKAGFCMVTLNYRFTADEHALQLADSGAACLIYAERFAAQVLPGAGRIKGLRRICLGVPAPCDAGGFDALVERASTAPPDTAVAELDLFYLGYTSGTTGRPKGAMVTQRNRALAYHYWALEFGIGRDDVALHCGPYHHTAPFSFTLAQLTLGGSVAILEQFDAHAALRAIERHRVTWSFMVPFMLERLLALSPEERRGYDLGSLRMIISGASMLSTRTKEGILEAFPGAQLHEFYGATEAGVITNLRPEDQQRKTRCVGRPVFDTEIEIRDESELALPQGEIGDIWLRGPTIFSGYYKAEDKTAEVFRGDWCTIGDVGRVDAEGYLYLVDRRKDLIKSGGVNVYPVEIEEVLLTDAAVGEVAVIGVPHAVWGESVHAVLVPRAGCVIDEAALLARCRSRLAGYKVPKSIEIREALPRNANGKILKRTLREECAVANPA
jgi:acyl-CoA synthetase (AMP-forming)/AMP-acid ligase II